MQKQRGADWRASGARGGRGTAISIMLRRRLNLLIPLGLLGPIGIPSPLGASRPRRPERGRLARHGDGPHHPCIGDRGFRGAGLRKGGRGRALSRAPDRPGQGVVPEPQDHAVLAVFHFDPIREYPGDPCRGPHGIPLPDDQIAGRSAQDRPLGALRGECACQRVRERWRRLSIGIPGNAGVLCLPEDGAEGWKVVCVRRGGPSVC